METTAAIIFEKLWPIFSQQKPTAEEPIDYAFLIAELIHRKQPVARLGKAPWSLLSYLQFLVL